MHEQRQSEWAVQGIIHAPVEQVWEALIELSPVLSATDKQMILHGHSADPYLTSIGKPSEGKISIDVQIRQHKIGIQGEWWYRGVHSVEAHPHGSLITYEVYNIAPKASRWMAQLVQAPAHARTMPAQMQALLGTIGTHLHCETEMLDNAPRHSAR